MKFLGNLNEAISMVETDLTLKVTYISGNGIAVFKFAQKIFFKGKLQQHQRQILSITPSRINPFVPNAPLLYPWKQQKTVRFSGVEKGCIGDEWVNTEKWYFCKHYSILGLISYKTFTIQTITWFLILSWGRSLPYRKQPTDLLC